MCMICIYAVQNIQVSVFCKGSPTARISLFKFVFV